MLIRLIEIDTEKQLAEALQNPVQKESRALYATAVPELAGRLSAEGLPCVFREMPREEPGVYGVDLVVDGRDESWRADGRLLENIWKRHYRIPWTIARTEHLLIRESVMEDLPELLEMYEAERENPDVQPFLEAPALELCAYIRTRYPFYGYGLWSVVERASGCVVGRAGFEELHIPDGADGSGQAVLQLSYLIEEGFRRRGYAKEAAQAMLAYAKECLEFARIALVTSCGNGASRSLALRLGFQREYGLEKKLSKVLDKRLVYVYDV